MIIVAMCAETCEDQIYIIGKKHERLKNEQINHSSHKISKRENQKKKLYIEEIN